MDSKQFKSKEIEEMLPQPFTPCPEQKVMLNIGALLDIPTGVFEEGRYGEMILNGGLSFLTGIVGQGNNFKSSIMRYMTRKALGRFDNSTGSTYDTEVNTHEWHLIEQTARIEELHGENILKTGRWVITDKTIYSGNKWYEVFKEFCELKVKNTKSIQAETPFWNRKMDGPFMMLTPTFTELDSFTEFETDDVTKMQDDNELGESGGNTIFMRQGLAKTRFLQAAPALNGASYNYLIATAHIGKESTMQAGAGGRDVPVTKLKHLKNGDAIKGATGKFTFITQNCWHAFNTTPLIQTEGNGPLYPRDSEDKLKYDTDLNIVSLRNLRSKSGISGMTIQLVVSQTEGVLPSLSEFHFIKEMDRFGLEGNVQNYSLALYPEVKLSRTTVRSKIDNDAKLRRALNITSEMCQIQNLWHNLDRELLCTPKQLYVDLITLGYDWNLILSQTRGWWTLANENKEHKLKFLSTMDLLRMRLKNNPYIPYWLETDKKTIKKEFL